MKEIRISFNKALIFNFINNPSHMPHTCIASCLLTCFLSAWNNISLRRCLITVRRIFAISCWFHRAALSVQRGFSTPACEYQERAITRGRLRSWPAQPLWLTPNHPLLLTWEVGYSERAVVLEFSVFES